MNSETQLFTGHKRKRPQTEHEDIFDRFTDPKRKKRKKEIQEKSAEEKRQEILSLGKLHAKDFFNEQPSKDDLKNWQRYVVAPPSEEKLDQLLKSMQECKDCKDCNTHIQFQSVGISRGLYCVFNFLHCVLHCKKWLQERLLELGWKENVTGYDPICVSHSINELLPAMIECYKMAIKQMKWIVVD